MYLLYYQEETFCVKIIQQHSFCTNLVTKHTEWKHIICLTDLFSAVGSVSVDVGNFFHFLSLQTPHTIPSTSNTATTPIAISPNSTPTYTAALLFTAALSETTVSRSI